MRETTWNRIFILGYLERDPSLRYRGDAVAVVELAVGVSGAFNGREAREDGGGGHVDVLFSGPAAQRFARVAGIGSAVFIEGRLRLELARGSNAGGRRHLVVVAERVSLLDAAVRSAPEAGGAIDVGAIDLRAIAGAPGRPPRRLPMPEAPAPRARSPDRRRARAPAAAPGDLFAGIR